MTVKRLSNIKLQYDDGNGVLASNYRLFFYAAGSSTKQNTYNSSAGSVANANPIVLNALGEPAVEIWLTAGQSYKVGLAIPGSDDPPASFVWTEDNITGVNDTTSAIDQWIAGVAPTFISAVSFSLVGDQTAIYHVGRRLKTTNSGGTVYSTIIASAFGALTTVTVANDSGTLDAGLSAVSYSLVSASDTSINADMVSRKGAAVASAATTNIWGIAGDYVHITGSTGPITSLGTAPYAGARRILIFDSTPSITNGANLKLPGGQDITAAVNDRALVVADTTTSHTVIFLDRALSRPAQFGEKHIAGLLPSNNVSDATNDIDISAGSARDGANAMDMVLAATITKRLDASWAVGTNQGGLDTGAIGNSDYYLWLIARSDTGVVDAIFSLSSTAPTMPASYDFKRLIGWFKRVGGTIVAFHTYEIEAGGLEMNWDVPTLDVNLANTLGQARTASAVKVPLNFSVIAHLNVMIFDATVNHFNWVGCPDQTDAAPSNSAAPLANLVQFATTSAAEAQMFIRTSATGTIAARSSAVQIDTYAISTMGFRWARRN